MLSCFGGLAYRALNRESAHRQILLQKLVVADGTSLIL